MIHRLISDANCYALWKHEGWKHEGVKLRMSTAHQPRQSRLNVMIMPFEFREENFENWEASNASCDWSALPFPWTVATM